MSKRSLSFSAALSLAVLILLIGSTCLAQGVTGTGVIRYGQGEALADEIIVQPRAGVPPAALEALNRAHGASVISRSPFAGFLRLRLPPGLSVAQAVAAYRQSPHVQYAEPNFIRRALFTPNDPYYALQWHLDDGATPNPYGGANGGGINLGPAWDLATGAGVVVAVLDTGIAYENYTERIGHLRKSYYLAPDLAQTRFVPGYDFINGDSHPNDDNSHGTHVAGTIAQSTDNATGVAGVAFGAALMPVKVLDSNGSGTDAQVADGIYFAVNNGAQVLNLSLGGPGASTTLGDAVAYAHQRGVTVVAAAGNEGNGANAPSYPAAYDEAIAVSATRYDETRAYYSNYGSYIDLAAPGGDVTVDQNGDGYGDGVLQNTFDPNTRKTGDFGYWFFQGTSMATPHVAGVAALVISNGFTTPDEVRAVLQSTAEDKGEPGWDPMYGWGIVDAAAALAYTPAPVHDVAVDSMEAPASAVQGEAVTVSVTASNPGDYPETFTVTLTDTTAAVVIGAQTVTDLAPGASETLTFTWDTTLASAGSHVLQARAAAVSGETDLADNARTATVSLVPAGQALHVASIDMALRRAGLNTAALANVTVVDASGRPVAGAVVSGHWSGATTDSDTATTDGNGLVTLQSNNVKRATSGTTYTFTVDSVSLAGWKYDAAANAETADSIAVP